MSNKQILRIIIDFTMTVILLLQMGYLRVGETIHEWLGVSMFILFIIHHILNRRWIAEIFHGKYTPFRVPQTSLAVLLLLTMTGSAISGIMLSKHVFSFLELDGMWFARSLHMLCGYWNFVLMSLHLGLHWVMVTGMISSSTSANSKTSKGTLTNSEISRSASANSDTSRESSYGRRTLKTAARVIAALIAVYGIYVMIARHIPEYLFGTVQFASFDLEEPLLLFLLDYMAVMGLFVFVGHYGSKLLRK